MKRVLLPALAALLTPSLALACPYASAASSASAGCGACGSSTLGYGVSLLLGVVAGFASVAVERRGRG